MNENDLLNKHIRGNITVWTFIISLFNTETGKIVPSYFLIDKNAHYKISFLYNWYE